MIKTATKQNKQKKRREKKKVEKEKNRSSSIMVIFTQFLNSFVCFGCLFAIYQSIWLSANGFGP